MFEMNVLMIFAIILETIEMMKLNLRLPNQWENGMKNMKQLPKDQCAHSVIPLFGVM